MSHLDKKKGKIYDMKEKFDIEIKKLRNNIDEIDKQILNLVSKRKTEVEKVVCLKKECNIPVYHPAREEDLISRLRTQAEKAGVDPEFMEELYRVILRNSRVNQTSEMKEQGLKAGSKILIVGGKGHMGSYFGKLFTASGYLVRILSEDNWHEVEALCHDVDLAILSVPIHSTLEIIEKFSPYLGSNTVLADFTSIKQEPLDAMLKHHSGPVIGLHPLFGATSATLDKQIIAVTPGRGRDQYQWLIDQLTIWGAILVNSDPNEHDEIMDIVQALRHFATFSFGQFISNQNINLTRTLEFSSPIYRLELGMVGRLFAQDSSLYSEIIFATPLRRKLLKKYIESLNEQLDMLENNDKALFMDKFKKIAVWFGPFSEQAMSESTFIINKLIERF